MFSTDFFSILQWWSMFLIVGIVFLPITKYLLGNFFDKGYIFSKILGIAITSYIIFVLGIIHLAVFNFINSVIVLVLIAISIFAFFIFKFDFATIRKKNVVFVKQHIFIFIFEEALFLVALFFWAWIRGFAPDIHGLEKFMDFGFINSILRSDYFPPKDMWFTPFSINYYYFGHLITAVLTKLSLLNPAVAFNLMLATIFAFCFTASFSIGANLIYQFKSKNLKVLIGGLLTAFLVSFAGNLHTIYLFFKPYQNDNPVPFWQLPFSPATFPNAYWYPNATRFIHNTIHEFPLYSFVVSDLHGHVLDIPFVLLTIAVLLSLIFNQNKNSFQISNFKFQISLISFLLAVMYMTNAWDGLIYFLLASLVVLYIQWQKVKQYKSSLVYLFILGVGFFLFTLPFSVYFKPFVSGIGVICAPDFLTNIGKLGPFLFEKDHCLRSPLWQLIILHGFFYVWVITFIVFLFRKTQKIKNLQVSDIFVLILIMLSTLLIIIPEFIYIKDIYPAHYRANTMFKLVYQSFIMLSISSGYIILRLISSRKFVYLFIGGISLFFVAIYPYFAVNSYYGNLKTYHGLNGLSYIKELYPADYQAILWLQKNATGQPVILEAQGDSYTDYARISANTGLPTVLGWTVHEWLWRGTYDIPSPRIEEVKTLYESSDVAQTKQLLRKYFVSLVFIGKLEREKYPNLNEEKFKTFGKPLYKNHQTTIYKVSP